MSNLKSKISSSEEFWNVIEKTYGEVEQFIKLVLQVNGFNSFLALKGIRYDDKNEFFQSLELTVMEILHSEYESQEKVDLEAELAANHQSIDSFRLRPGHRNFIMNLMLEVENTDVIEFFGRCVDDYQIDANDESQQEIASQSSDQLLVRAQSENQIIISQLDHEYSRDDQQFILEEEEYLTEVEYEDQPLTKKRKSSSKTSNSVRKRPDHMYNEEFLAKSTNPRKRRLTTNKTYPNTDEGTRQRFADLIRQSMQCILPTEMLPEVDNADIYIEKDRENSWVVTCPLCDARLRLPVVKENDGKYFNYKRSNFERHLRFKHCKTQESHKSDETFHTIEMIEEIGD